MLTGPHEVLLAEDNAADVFLVQRAVESITVPVNLHVVSDGDRAVRFIEAADQDENAPCPELLLLDLNLPKRSGQEVLERLRRSPRCGGIPVVIISSSQSPREKAAAAALGVAHYFRKPSDYDEFMTLGTIVRNMLTDTQAR